MKTYNNVCFKDYNDLSDTKKENLDKLMFLCVWYIAEHTINIMRMKMLIIIG